MEKLTDEQFTLRDKYLYDCNLVFNIEYGEKRNKLIATSKKENENFRSFAYFTTSSSDAKTALLMEYRQQSWSKF